MKTVLVTGANGWIGRHCSEVLLRQGWIVHGICRRTTMDGNPGVTWHELDLLDHDNRSCLIQDLRPTHILHLAWEVTPGIYRTAASNWDWLLASIDLLDTFARNGGERFVGIGTCLEYNWRRGFCREDEPAAQPSTPYGAAKLALAKALGAWSSVHGLSAAWGRVFFPFGPGEPASRLIPSVLEALLKNQATFCSEGKQLRDFIYIKDVAGAIAALLNSPVEGAVNICSGRATSIRALVAAFVTRIGAGDSIHFGARQAVGDDAEPLVVGDPRRLNLELGWYPAPLEVGIEETITWWRHQFARHGAALERESSQ